MLKILSLILILISDARRQSTSLRYNLKTSTLLLRLAYIVLLISPLWVS